MFKKFSDQDPFTIENDARAYVMCEFAFPLNMLERAVRHGNEFELRPYFRALRSYRRDDWKYIWASDGRDSLFNLANDPTEQTDLINEHRETARELYDQLDAVLARIPVNDYGDWMITEYTKGTPRHSWDKLKRWGYLRRGQADRPAFRN